MKQEMAMSIIPRLYTHPPSRPRKGLYTARSGTVRLPLQSAGYCDTPPVLRLSPSHPLFLSSPKPPPPLLHPNPFPTSPLLFQPLFFAAPTSSSFTPSSPPLVEAAREESCLHTGPPFPRADGLSPFSPRPDASTRKLFTFSSFLPSCSPFPCLSLFLPSFLPLPLLSHGCERVI